MGMYFFCACTHFDQGRNSREREKEYLNYKKKKKKVLGWAQWLIPIVPVLLEAKMEDCWKSGV